MSMFYVSTNLSHQAGDGSTESYVTLPIAARLNSVRLCPNVAVTADNTNYVTFKVIDNGATDIFEQNTRISGGSDKSCSANNFICTISPLNGCCC